MSLVVMPILDVVAAEAPFTEWAPNMDVSMPAAYNKAFSYFAVELEMTMLCCRMTAMNSLFSPSLRGSVPPCTPSEFLLDKA